MYPNKPNFWDNPSWRSNKNNYFKNNKRTDQSNPDEANYTEHSEQLKPKKKFDDYKDNKPIFKVRL